MTMHFTVIVPGNWKLASGMHKISVSADDVTRLQILSSNLAYPGVGTKFKISVALWPVYQCSTIATNSSTYRCTRNQIMQHAFFGRVINFNHGCGHYLKSASRS